MHFNSLMLRYFLARSSRLHRCSSILVEMNLIYQKQLTDNINVVHSIEEVDTVDIAALSIGLAQSNLKQAVGISVLNMSKDQASGDAQALVKMLEQSVQPNLGGNIDIKA